jgi:cytochrome c-type biogenesis protein CcmF
MPWNDIGNLSIQLALVFAAYSVAAGVIGALQRNLKLSASAEKCTYLVTFLVTIPVLCVVALLLSDDFNNRYVWSVSATPLPFIYKLSALWAGQAGSLLFWTWIFTIFASLAALRFGREQRHVMPWVNAIVMANVFFFLWVNVFDANPFLQYFEIGPETRELFMPREGNGLNPQLHHPLMVIHPGVLYIGYIGFMIPFAFAMGSLLAGDSSGRWLRATRRWTMFAWLSLGIGIVLGCRWAYTELGWGGYWAWDPVENASLMPWLAATALLHSMLLQERQGMLKRYNVVLTAVTYLLCLFGAFLTRSGLISSVHAYAKSEVGKHFSVFMIAIIGATIAIMVWRLSKLKGGRPLGSFFSRDGLLFWNNLFLLIGTVIVFIGTMMPAITEALKGGTREVEPGFFNKATPPVAIVLLLLLGMLPASRWKTATLDGILKRAMVPGIAGIVAGLAVFALGWMSHPYSILAVGATVFALVGVTKDFFDDTVKLQQRDRETGFGRALLDQFRLLPRRSGAHLVHLGVALMVLGFAGASLNESASGSIRAGENLKLGDLRFQLEGMEERQTDLYRVATATVTLWDGEKQLATLKPEARLYYNDADKRTSEVAIHSNLMRDVYVVFGGYADRQREVASLDLYSRPLVNWVWIGGILALIGSLFCFGPFAGSEATVPGGATEPAV